MDKSDLETVNEKLEILSLLKEAASIPCKSINFIILSFLASLPFLCLSASFEAYLRRTLVEVSDTVATPSSYYHHHWYPVSSMVSVELIELFSSKAITFSLLYMVPLHLLEFCSILSIVTLASKLYSADKLFTVEEIIQNPMGAARLKSILITSLVVRFFSTCFLVGLMWLALNYFLILRHTIYDVYFAVVVGGVFLLMLVKYLEGSAEWSMATVISIAEEDIRGVEPFALSACLSRGNEGRGCLLILVFIAWGVALRLSCLSVGCYKGGNGIFVQLVLIFMGNMMKWLAFVVYFYDCKKRALDMQVDEEAQILLQAVDAQ